MDNQVNLSYFSPVNVHLVLKYYKQHEMYSYVYFIKSFHSKKKHEVDVCTIILKVFLFINYQSDNSGHVVDCIKQVFQQSFHHVDHFTALEIHI